MLLMSAPVLPALDLNDLETYPNLTPKRFAGFFESFDYKFFSRVQPPSQFLGYREGDCDDYAAIADHVLRPDGYTTRLIHIRLAGMVAHAVCYVEEDRIYLDYNNRNVFFTLTKARPSIRAIAEKVARSLNANWTSASEFLYSYQTDRKTVVSTVTRTDPPATDPPLGASPAPNRFQVD